MPADPPRDMSPFGQLPQIVDVRTLQNEVRKHPQAVFDAILRLVAERDAAVAENKVLNNEIEHLNDENSNIRGNWMDVRDQTLEKNQLLMETQVALAKAITREEHTKKQLADALEDHNQSRLDWKARAQRYEELLAIQKSKQVIQWKLIERLQKGSLDEEETDLEVTVPPWTGTKKTSCLFDTPNLTASSRSSSTVVGGPGSPEKSFNPTAASSDLDQVSGSANI